MKGMKIRSVEGNKNRIAIQYLKLDESAGPNYYRDSAAIYVDFKRKSYFIQENTSGSIFGQVLCSISGKNSLDFSRFSGPWIDLLDSKARDIKHDLSQLASLSVKDSSGNSVEVQARLNTTTEVDELTLDTNEHNPTQIY